MLCHHQSRCRADLIATAGRLAPIFRSAQRSAQLIFIDSERFCLPFDDSASSFAAHGCDLPLQISYTAFPSVVANEHFNRFAFKTDTVENAMLFGALGNQKSLSDLRALIIGVAREVNDFQS